MARKKSGRRKKKSMIDDTQRKLMLAPGATGGGGTHVNFFSIPSCLSAVNRRLYRQCRCYYGSLEIANTVSSSQRRYEIYTLSSAWWVKRSIQSAKQFWLTATRNERKMLKGNIGKYNDFTIFPPGDFVDFDVQTTTITAPETITTQDLIRNETLGYSQALSSGIEMDQDEGGGYEKVFGVGAADTTGSLQTWNIFDEYLKNLNIDPISDTRGGAYADAEEADEVAMDHLQQDGDEPPWDADAFPGPFVQAAVISADQDGGGFNFPVSPIFAAPLGMVIVKKTNNSGGVSDYAEGGDSELAFNAAPGNYRGVLAPAY